MNVKDPKLLSNIHKRIEEFCERGFPERIKSLASKQNRQESSDFLTLLRASIGRDPNIDLLTETAIACEDLFVHGHYLREAGTFLGEILREEPADHQARQLANRAFETLLVGLKSRDQEIAAMCTTALGFVLEQLSANQRQLLRTGLESAKNTNRNLKKLRDDIGSYLDKITCLDEAFEVQRQDVPVGRVYSVHSTKGGVGKSTVAIALAVELARNPKNRVCLVDADDEGPSLEFYLPVETKANQNAYRFSDWFTSPSATHHFPDTMLVAMAKEPGHPWTERISVIPSSILADDIERVSSHQRRARGEKGSHRPNRQRMVALTGKILGPWGFTHVIYDTAPGLAHLAYDVLLSTIEMNGRLILVMRPRAPDIISMFSEHGYLTRNSLDAHLNIVLDFVSRASVISFEDPTAVAAALARTPITAGYMELFPETVTLGNLQPFLCSCLSRIKEKEYAMPHEQELVHAADLLFDQRKYQSVAEVVAKNKSCRDLAGFLLEDKKPTR